MLLQPVLGELADIVLVGDRLLRSKYIATKLLSECRADFLLNVSRTDCAIESPNMSLNREVVAKQRNIGCFGRVYLKRMGMSTGGTTEVFKDNDSEARCCEALHARFR